VIDFSKGQKITKKDLDLLMVPELLAVVAAADLYSKVVVEAAGAELLLRQTRLPVVGASGRLTYPGWGGSSSAPGEAWRRGMRNDGLKPSFGSSG